MSDPSISFELLKCISTLEFISSIPEGHKPCYNTQSTISKDAWFTTFRRRWGGEKGEYGIIHINKVLDSCDHHYRMCLNQGGRGEEVNKISSDLKELHTALVNSVIGFDNLIKTYKDQKEVLENYKECKQTVTNLIRKIDLYLISLVRVRANNKVILKEETSRKEETTSSSYDSYDSYDDYGDHFVTGWGLLTDSFDSEKNPMVVSLVVSADSSDARPSFFTTNNMVLLKANKRNSKYARNRREQDRNKSRDKSKDKNRVSSESHESSSE